MPYLLCLFGAAMIFSCPAPVAAGSADAPAWHDLWLPGGVAAFAEVAGLPEPIDRARLWIDLTRRVHTSETGDTNLAVLQELRAYVDAIDGLQRALRQAAWPAAGLSLTQAATTLGSSRLSTVLSALGLALDDGERRSLGAGDGPRASLRRRLLKKAGVDVEQIQAQFSAGEVVRLEIRREMVPSPLSIDQWRRVIGANADDPATGETLTAGHVFVDRRAALLGYGLLAVDAETLRTLASDPETLVELYDRRAGSFAAFGRSVQIRDGRVQVPGGADAAAFWTDLVEAPLTQPGAFIRRLFDTQDGRLAFFYDTLAHLDTPRLAFAIGRPGISRDERDRLGRALYRSFVTIDSEWDLQALPFSRPTMSPLLWLLEVSVGPAGEPLLPRARKFWDAAFARGDALHGTDATASHLLEDAEIDAAWLTSRVLSADPVGRRERVFQVLFAQRVFGPVDRVDVVDTLIAVRGIASMPALVLTLERMGVTEPSLYAQAVRAADRLASIADSTRASHALAQFQGGLALLDRFRRSNALPAPEASALLRSLCSIPVGDDDTFDGGMVQWLTDRLLPAVQRSLHLESVTDAEDIVVAALAGAPAAGEPPAIVEWEGDRYHVDLAEREVVRLRAVRERQGGDSLEGVLAFARAAALAKTASSLDALRAAIDTFERVSAGVKALQPDRQAVRTLAADETVVRALKDLRKIRKPGDLSQARGSATSLLALGDALLGRVLISLIYAASLGDPEGTVLLAGDVGLRHELGAGERDDTMRRRTPWMLPEESTYGGRPWHVRGSLLALDVGLARFALRRLSNDVPSRPSLNGNDRRTFSETVVLFDPRAVTDGDRSAIAAAIGRGRSRVQALGEPDADLEAVTAAAGFTGWQRHALAWMRAHEPDRLLSMFSLGELLAVGAPDASLERRLDRWGTSAIPVTGCLCLRFPPRGSAEAYEGRQDLGLLASATPDLPLRVAELLDALKLPAVLAAGVLPSVTLEFVESVQTAYHDDWLRMALHAQALSEERMTDHVSALTAVGALVPEPSTIGIPR